jgi:lipid II:glycine glycyltransferase (peptidoglycan interpeptide bridge formation enzyme)
MARFVLAQIDDTSVACSLELLYKDTIYGWYGGTDRQYGKHNPSEIMHWRIFEWGAKQGFSIYDFGGAGKPDEEYGVRDFKAKFGGELVDLGRYTCIHAPLRLKLSKVAYRLYQQVL